MTHALSLLSWLVLPFIGIAAWRIDFVRRMPLSGRLAVSGALGALITGVVMFVMSIVSIPWSRTTLFVALAAIAATGWWLARRNPGMPVDDTSTDRTSRLVSAGMFVIVALMVYGALDARISSGDLHYFWGPKAVRFHSAQTIDTGFLSNRDFYSMHPDYPPLLPLLYAWSNVLSRSFSWWAAVLTAPLLLLGIGAVVHSCSRDHLGTLLVVATMAQAMAIGYAAGAAEPLLIFFECLALCAVIFVDDPRAQVALAAIGLAGAAWTKIEGATFAIAFVMALVVVWRQWKPIARIAAPAIALVVAWTAYISVAGVLDMYAAASRYPIHLHTLPKTLKLIGAAASYDIAWIPWIAPLLLIAIGDIRRAVLPLIVAILTIGAAVYFYLHAEDAAWWIAASAPRVLMTPLLALDLAAIAASTRRRASPELEAAIRQ